MQTHGPMPPDTPRTSESAPNRRWPRLVIGSATFGVGFALTLSAIIGITTWYKARPKPWNTGAVTGTYGSLEFGFSPEVVTVDFGYDLRNATPSDYRIDKSNLVVMAKLTEGNVLSKTIGTYQSGDVVVDGPVFIPSMNKARITLRVSYSGPDRFDDSHDLKKVADFVDRRLKEISGFVIYDQSAHYQISLPSGWEQKTTDSGKSGMQTHDPLGLFGGCSDDPKTLKLQSGKSVIIEGGCTKPMTIRLPSGKTVVIP